MGHVWIDLKVSCKGRTRTVKGLVDTGATLTTLPKDLYTELGVEVVSSERVQTGAGTVEIHRGQVTLEIRGRKDTQTVWLSDLIDKVLVGAVTLETLGLKVNPVTGRIEDSPLMLYPAGRP